MKKANLKAVGGRIIAVRLEKPEKTAGGIVLPDSAENKTARAEVAGGNSDEIKKGDIIIFHNDNGVDVVDKNDDKYIILDLDDVLAVEI